MQRQSESGSVTLIADDFSFLAKRINYKVQIAFG